MGFGMAGRVLRDSKGRFNGSTRGWRRGLKGPKQSKRQVAMHTAKRAFYAGSKRVAINSIRHIASGAATGTAAGILGANILTIRKGYSRSTAGKLLVDSIKAGAIAGATVGGVRAIAGARSSFQSAAAASAHTGMMNRAAARVRKANPKMSKAESYRKVYRSERKARGLLKFARRA